MGEILIPGAREREKGGGEKGQLQGRRKGGKIEGSVRMGFAFSRERKRF